MGWWERSSPNRGVRCSGQTRDVAIDTDAVLAEIDDVLARARREDPARPVGRINQERGGRDRAAV
jgi:hypothetical protein